MIDLRPGDMIDDRYMVWSLNPLKYFDSLTGNLIHIDESYGQASPLLQSGRTEHAGNTRGNH